MSSASVCSDFESSSILYGLFPDVAIQGRSGSDVLLAPVTAGELLAAYASPLPRLRRDFWRAFIEFPVETVARLYDPDEDKIVHVEAGAQRPGIEIEPVSREMQLQWRKTFSGTAGDDQGYSSGGS